MRRKKIAIWGLNLVILAGIANLTLAILTSFSHAGIFAYIAWLCFTISASIAYMGIHNDRSNKYISKENRLTLVKLIDNAIYRRTGFRIKNREETADSIFVSVDSISLIKRKVKLFGFNINTTLVDIDGLAIYRTIEYSPEDGSIQILGDGIQFSPAEIRDDMDNINATDNAEQIAEILSSSKVESTNNTKDYFSEVFSGNMFPEDNKKNTLPISAK